MKQIDYLKFEHGGYTYYINGKDMPSFLEADHDERMQFAHVVINPEGGFIKSRVAITEVLNNL